MNEGRSVSVYGVELLFEEYLREDLFPKALNLVDRGALSKFDPVVSEWGCQLRAFCLTKLIKDAVEVGSFSDEHLKFLGCALFLTESTDRQKICPKNPDCFVLAINGKTNESKLPKSFQSFLSRKQLNVTFSKACLSKFYANVKRSLASEQMKILLRFVDKYEDSMSISAELVDELRDRIRNPFSVSFSKGTRIPCLPLFDTMVLFNELVSAMRLDIVVNLRRITRHSETTGERTAERALLFFRVDDDGNFQHRTAPTDRSTSPVVLLDMYSTVATGFDCSADTAYTFHKEPLFEKFVPLLLEEVDLKDHLLQYFAVHPQFTQAKPTEEHLMLTSHALNQLHSKYYEKGVMYRVGQETYDTSPGRTAPFETTIPLNLLHCRVSSVEEVLDLKF